MGLVGVLPDTAGEGPALICCCPASAAWPPSLADSVAVSASASGSAAALVSSDAFSCSNADL